tara:strand:+ start:332 stop:559 length:228 start_codon:yes stop_codon:yes gene_type:complete
MNRIKQSSAYRAKMAMLLTVLHEYYTRIRLMKEFKILEQKVRRIEELHGVKRYPEITSNMNTSSSLNEIVLTRSG